MLSKKIINIFLIINSYKQYNKKFLNFQFLPKGCSHNNAHSTIKAFFLLLSNLFNSYTQAINKRYRRHGGLFERPFKRKLVDNEKYFKTLIVYIHDNPVHHGFTEHSAEWGWSSYLSCISIKSTKLKRETVLGWFDNMSNFKILHEQKINVIKIEKRLFE